MSAEPDVTVCSPPLSERPLPRWQEFILNGPGACLGCAGILCIGLAVALLTGRKLSGWMPDMLTVVIFIWALGAYPFRSQVHIKRRFIHRPPLINCVWLACMLCLAIAAVADLQTNRINRAERQAMNKDVSRNGAAPDAGVPDPADLWLLIRICGLAIPVACWFVFVDQGFNCRVAGLQTAQTGLPDPKGALERHD